MTTDKKTLADVQPGGRVRLGHHHGGEHAALAAQPSPAGQGDAPTAAMIEAAIGAFFKGQQWSSIGDKAAVEAKMRVTLEAALAARHPVGQEPVAWVNGGHLDECIAMPMIESNDDATVLNPRNIAASSRPDGYTDTPLYRHPAQAVDLGQFRELAQKWADRANLAPSPMTARTCSQQLMTVIDSQAVKS